MGAAPSKCSCWPAKATLPSPSELFLTFDSSEAWRQYFNSIKHSSRLVAVEFTDPYCDACKGVEPDVLHMTSKYTKIQFIKMHGRDVLDIAREYELLATPTFVLLRKGEEVDRVKSLVIEDIEEVVSKHNSKVYPPRQPPPFISF